jgi:hypothetical protein
VPWPHPRLAIDAPARGPGQGVGVAHAPLNLAILARVIVSPLIDWCASVSIVPTYDIDRWIAPHTALKCSVFHATSILFGQGSQAEDQETSPS